MQSRRKFLLTSTAIGSASILNAAVPSHALKPSTPQAFKKAVKLAMVHDGDTILDKFKLLKELGFDGVELDSPNGYKTQEVLDARDKTGLPIHGVVDSTHWQKTFNHNDPEIRKAAVTDLKIALQDAHDFGASTVLVVPAVVNKSQYYSDAWKLSHEGISSALDLSEKLGVKIAFENVWNNFLLSPMEMVHWIDSFDSKMVGAYFDVGNILRYGWPEHWIRALGHRVLKIDVKEYSRKKADKEGIWAGFGAELLEGDCDWPTVMKELKAINYDGWFTAEIGGGGRERLEQIATNMDKILTS